MDEREAAIRDDKINAQTPLGGEPRIPDRKQIRTDVQQEQPEAKDR
jgi:hypothetical protein